MLLTPGKDLVHLFTREPLQLQQVLHVAFADGFAFLNGLVKHRLSETWLITLVVSQPAVAMHVDHHVPLEGRAIIHREFYHLGHCLRIFTVHMEDGDLKHLGYIGGVVAGARLTRAGREADLVVDHHVKRAAHGIAFQFTQVERLLHHALARKSGVAMNQNRQAFRVFRVLNPVLFSAHTAKDLRIYKFQMARVKTKRQVNALAGNGLPIAAVAKVIFDIAPALEVFPGLIGELAEDEPRMLAHDVCQHIQAAPVGHAEDNFLDALLSGAFDRQIEQGDETFRAFEGEAFGSDEFFTDKFLESDRVCETCEDAELFLARDLQPVLGAFHALLQPLARDQVVDVHVLDADGSAISVPEAVEDFAERLCTFGVKAFG